MVNDASSDYALHLKEKREKGIKISYSCLRQKTHDQLPTRNSPIG